MSTALDKSTLVCSKCNLILVEAVEVDCCHNLYCEACLKVSNDPSNPTLCQVCQQPVLQPPRPNIPVRKLIGSMPATCPNEGCSEIFPSRERNAHLLVCEYEKVQCCNFDAGCVQILLRKQKANHEANRCVYRIVECPQGCGYKAQSREMESHVQEGCPYSMVECDVKCGELMRREQLHSHMSQCMLQPVMCPYRSLGCDLRHLVPRKDLEAHMACSVHAHLMLLDSHYRTIEAELTEAGPAIAASSHDWDPTYVQAVGKWPAQESTIRALCFLGKFLAVGAESGSVMIFDVASGECVSNVEASEHPIRSILGSSDGRLFLGLLNNTIQVRSDLGQVLCKSHKLHPTNPSCAFGVLAMARAILNKQTHLRSRPHLLHSELYAVKGSEEKMLDGTFEVVAAAFEMHVRLLDGATLEELTVLEGHKKTVNCVAVNCVAVKNSQLLSGSADGTVRLVDLSKAEFPCTAIIDCSTPVSVVIFGPANLANGIVIGCNCGTLQWWTISGDGTEAMLHHSCEGAHKQEVCSLCVADSEHVVSGGTDEALRVWDTLNDFSLIDLPCSSRSAVSCAKMLYVGGAQGCVRVWTALRLKFRQAPTSK